MGLVLDLLVRWAGAAERQQDLLAHRLTCFDIISKKRAVGKQWAGASIFVGVCRVSTLIAEVGARVASTSLIWENIDEANWDDIEVSIGAEMGQA